VTNTASFDIPGNEVSQNAGYNNFAPADPGNASPLPTGCGTQNAAPGAGGIYSCAGGLGLVGHTIGAPRQIQMSLHLDF
jgi:hypothetical protein